MSSLCCRLNVAGTMLRVWSVTSTEALSRITYPRCMEVGYFHWLVYWPWPRTEPHLYLYCVVFIGNACSEHLWHCFLKAVTRLLIPSRNVTKCLDRFIVVCMNVGGFLILSFKALETSSSLFISSPVARVVSFAACNKWICCFIELPATEVCLEVN